jgi:probable phosphoglycerate mutase
MTLVYLVRHADHDYVGRGLAGRLGVPLNAAGRVQAERLGRWFGRERVSAVWSSPLPRTLDTAAPIARAHGLPVREADALLEVEFGAWTGKEFAALEDDADWQRWNGIRSLSRPPGGESMSEVQGRMVDFINQLRNDDPDGAHVLVGHGDPIRVALAYYLGVAIDLFLRIEVSPASISVLSMEPWGPCVLRVNGSSDEGSIAPAP